MSSRDEDAHAKKSPRNMSSTYLQTGRSKNEEDASQEGAEAIPAIDGGDGPERHRQLSGHEQFAVR
jgi:hypothetical protein